MNLEIKLNEVCNENCSYCIENINLININKRKQFDIKYLSKLDKVNLSKYNNIDLFGGEPGLIDTNDFIYLLEYLKNKQVNYNNIRILTNGLFLDKYKDKYNEFTYVYHIISPDKFKIYNNINNIIYTYVIYNVNSINELIYLSNKYKDIKFYSMMDELKTSFNDLNDNFIREYKNLLINNKHIDIIFPAQNKGYNLKKLLLASLDSPKKLKAYINFTNSLDCGIKCYKLYE